MNVGSRIREQDTQDHFLGPYPSQSTTPAEYVRDVWDRMAVTWGP